MDVFQRLNKAMRRDDGSPGYWRLVPVDQGGFEVAGSLFNKGEPIAFRGATAAEAVERAAAFAEAQGNVHRLQEILGAATRLHSLVTKAAGFTDLRDELFDQLPEMRRRLGEARADLMGELDKTERP